MPNEYISEDQSCPKLLRISGATYPSVPHCVNVLF